MAKTKTRKKAPARGNIASGGFSIAVAFGNVNIGDKTCRLGFTVPRDVLSIGMADDSLCDRRLTGRIVARSTGGSDQQSLPGVDADTTITGTFDVKGFSVTRKTISAGLTFALASIDVESLAHFAKRSGQVIITEVADLPTEDKSATGDATEED